MRNEGDLTKEAVDDSKQTAHDADEGRQCLIPALQRLFTGCTPEGIIWLRGQQLEPQSFHSTRHSAGNGRGSPSQVNLTGNRGQESVVGLHQDNSASEGIQQGHGGQRNWCPHQAALEASLERAAKTKGNKCPARGGWDGLKRGTRRGQARVGRCWQKKKKKRQARAPSVRGSIWNCPRSTWAGGDLSFRAREAVQGPEEPGLWDARGSY